MQENEHQEIEGFEIIHEYTWLDKYLPDLILMFSTLDKLIPGFYGPSSSFENPPNLLNMEN